ncbi:MAG: hypothetical protein IJA69_06415 [Clostridia bacterium]|nr:hypothetical protein [Clostridia bacterium]
MMFKNSMKLLFANFSIFWKVLLYKLIVVGICTLLFLPVLNIFVSAFSAANFGAVLLDFLTNTVFLNLTSLFSNLFVLVETFLSALAVVWQTSAFAIIYGAFLLFVVLPFLLGLSSVPAGECLYSYMATLSKQKFSVAFVNRLGISCVYSIFRTLVFIPIFVAFFAALYGLLTLTTIQGVIEVVLPFVIFVVVVLGVSLMLTFFSGWLPATVTFCVSPALTLKKGLKASFRRFFKILSSLLVILFITVCLCMMLTSFSLIVLIPLAEALIIMFEMVMFFESQGNRYYVDFDTICTPKKLEECDSIKKTKLII